MGIMEEAGKAAREWIRDVGKVATNAFYPAADSYWLNGNIVVNVETPGYTLAQIKRDIITRKVPADITGKTKKVRVLIIEGERDKLEETLKSQKNAEIIFSHRLHKFVKEIHLEIDEEDDPKIDEKSLALKDGVLTITITNLKKTVICHPF